MDFIEQLHALSAKVQKQKDTIQTEEATKNAFILPFISALGYDVFDPCEVVPEFTADVGIKKGEKADYAIFHDGKVIVLLECKKCGTDLSSCHASQLYRYFSVTEARIAILCDGIHTNLRSRSFALRYRRVDGPPVRTSIPQHERDQAQFNLERKLVSVPFLHRY